MGDPGVPRHGMYYWYDVRNWALNIPQISHERQIISYKALNMHAIKSQQLSTNI